MGLIATPLNAAERWLMVIIAALVVFGAGTVAGVHYEGTVRDAREAKAEAQQLREHAAQAKAVQAQKDRNIELQRAAEKNYVVAQQAQDHFFVTTVKEIHDAAAPLAACPVPDAVRVRLNAAAACARGDSPAACGAAGEVPSP